VGDFVNRLLEKDAANRPDASEALAEVQNLMERRLQPAESLRQRSRAETGAPYIAVLVVVLAVAGIVSGFARVKTAAKPSVVIPASQIAEFEAKRQALAEADALYDARKFDEALVKYDEYLKKYPDSAAAADGRQKSIEAIEKAVRKRPSEDEDISPSELLDRIRRVFRRQ
jgi:TolA-binding protein